MKINFDFYTDSANDSAKAFNIAVESDAADVSIRYSEDSYGKKINIMGTIDHRNIDPLFSFFEENDFTEEY